MGFFGEPGLNRHYIIAFCEKFFNFVKVINTGAK